MVAIDFRSDTVAMPSPEMRKAMVEAPLGDDVFGDDPTTNRLMEVAAERMGKEAATFVPSGTMGNLIGIAVNARRGEELIGTRTPTPSTTRRRGRRRSAGSRSGPSRLRPG